MKALKVVIKEWNLKRKDSLTREKEELPKKIMDFDANIASRSSDFIIDSQRAFWINRLRDIELKENTDASQKAKIRWDIEADENSNFFHAIVNQKRRYLSVKGIKVEGIWIEDPKDIKDAFLSFFEKKFHKFDVVKIVNRSPFYKSITSYQNIYLASPFSESEIKEAIWYCGSDKSPGPDGFTFAFYKEFWNVVKSDVFAFVRHFFSAAMEGLHVAIEDAMSAGLYNGFRINTLNLFHLFFIDDALFIGEWSNTNIKSLVSILDCFHQVYGLKINFNKSNLFGVGVPFAEVVSLASIIGCNALSTPFNYLGLPIDCNMALVKSWDPIIDKFSKRLSNWKASLLSIGGRTTLITSVLGVIALASNAKGGLSIGSLYSLNHALIQKWRW
nr:RNA-directed DNA polymerase, eukaryota, reverse transcriptase zinc-binding domain protein [Tanacetum cinerariifolium]